MTYHNAATPLHERVSDLLGQMTLDEKLAQLYSFWMFDLLDGDHQLSAEKLKALLG